MQLQQRSHDVIVSGPITDIIPQREQRSTAEHPPLKIHSHLPHLFHSSLKIWLLSSIHPPSQQFYKCSLSAHRVEPLEENGSIESIDAYLNDNVMFY